MLLENSVKKKEYERKLVQRHIASFMHRGGHITVIPSGVGMLQADDEQDQQTEQQEDVVIALGLNILKINEGKISYQQ